MNDMKIECTKIETPKNFVKEWLDYSKSHDDESFFAFMSLFMAFNHLYAKKQFRQIGEKLVNRGSGAAIKDCVEDILTKILEKDPAFTIEPLFGELNNPVYEGERYMYPDDKEVAKEDGKIVELIEKERCACGRRKLILKVQIVMLRVFQVRNNLFHGGKYPTFSRNIKLVHDSAVVMKKLLETYIELGFGDDPRDWGHGL